MATKNIASTTFYNPDRLPFECTKCGKDFKSKSSLKQHMHVHGSVKPHICIVCKKAYTEQTSLCRHRRKSPECRKDEKLSLPATGSDLRQDSVTAAIQHRSRSTGVRGTSSASMEANGQILLLPFECPRLDVSRGLGYGLINPGTFFLEAGGVQSRGRHFSNVLPSVFENNIRGTSNLNPNTSYDSFTGSHVTRALMSPSQHSVFPGSESFNLEEDKENLFGHNLRGREPASTPRMSNPGEVLSSSPTPDNNSTKPPLFRSTASIYISSSKNLEIPDQSKENISECQGHVPHRSVSTPSLSGISVLSDRSEPGLCPPVQNTKNFLSIDSLLLG